MIIFGAVSSCCTCFHNVNTYHCLEYYIVHGVRCAPYVYELSSIKATLYVHTVTSHCVSCKHVTRTIARTVWVLFCTRVITDSILVDLYPPLERHWHTWMHTPMHMHTTTHACTCNTQICMYIYAHNTTHAHAHTTPCACRRHSHTWTHTLMHMYTQPHMHAHATHKYPCAFTNTTPHTHMHT